MKQTVTMPALSDTMSAGRLSRWLKNPGDPIKQGEAIAEVETDKAVMEVEAFHAGFLSGPLAPLDTDLALGAPIAYIVDSRGEALADVGAPAAKIVDKPVPAPAAPAPAKPQASPQPPRLSPYQRAQVQAAHAPLPDLSEGPPHRMEKLSSLRAAAAKGMIDAAATPTFHVSALLPFESLDVSAKARGLPVTVLLARAAALTVVEHPLFNAVYMPDGLARRDQVDIGIAMDIPEGLITPVLRDVARRPLADLAADWNALKDKMKSRRLVPKDYRGATFYVSDLGVFPVITSFASIVPLGASAILSISAAGPSGAMFTLGCDHRVIFGADAARFLTTLADRLSKPDELK